MSPYQGVRILNTAIHILLCYTIARPAHAFRFKDVTRKAGLEKKLTFKFGGAAVADLDADGLPDLLLVHHDAAPELYFNNGDGTFKKRTQLWMYQQDTHGINPFRHSPYRKRMQFCVSRGGQTGTLPNNPRVFRIGPNRNLTQITHRIGMPYAKGRGRSAVFMPLRMSRSLVTDVVLFNAPSRIGDARHQKAMKGTWSGKFKPRRLSGSFTKANNWYGTGADLTNSNRIDLVAFQNLSFHRVIADFKLRDITSRLLPRDVQRHGVVAVAVLDYNNDGRWDLYVARTYSGDLSWLRDKMHLDDYLLESRGDRFVDVSREAGIPRLAQSRGVTTGDFNNDGYVDIVVTRFDKPDLMLINRGNGKFRTVSARLWRRSHIPGDMATAVDYDRDGRLDLVVSEGAHAQQQGNAGFYRILRNVGHRGNWVLVRVGHAPGRSATSHYAVVTVVAGQLRMMRQVGSPGTAVSNSYIELLHFGLGYERMAAKITVRWLNGKTETRRNVRSGRRIRMGMV